MTSHKVIINFILLLSCVSITNTVSAQEDKGAFIHYETQADYPGGVRAWLKHMKPLKVELKPPCPEGKVYLGFIVRKTGKIDSVKVIRGLCELADKNAIEILEKSGTWNPGRNRGQAVDSRMNVQVVYRYK